MPLLDNLDGWKLVVLILIGIFIFGPDKLPKAIAEGVKMLRNLREMARNATGDLSRELGTDIQLEDLNPKTLIRKHLLSEEDERALRKPIEDLYQDVKKDLTGVHSELKSVAETVNKPLSAGGSTSVASRPALDADAT
jgi:sec-independent protein translocase protein TatB